MSATRSVLVTLAANLVIGVIMSTCGKSWSEPILCCVSAPWPPMCSTGTFGPERGRDAGHRIGAPGPGGGHDASELAGLARIAVSGMGRDLLMTHVDDPDALIDAAVVDVDDVAAAEREYRIHPFGLQRLRHQMAARYDAGLAALALQGVLRGRGLLIRRSGINGCHVCLQ